MKMRILMPAVIAIALTFAAGFYFVRKVETAPAGVTPVADQAVE
jgi:hypothetical protein